MKIILGTMTFSDQADETAAAEMLELFSKTDSEIDTAHQYNKGKTEMLLGHLLAGGENDRFHVATKVNPWDGDGLTPREVSRQFTASLARLRTDRVDLLYLHSPDLNTPIQDTLEACNEHYRQGRFKRFGLSNFASWQVAEAAEICRRENWMIPTVYQGMYNALTRDVERELFPCLRNYGISFYVYNPLAGGMLTGKHTSAERIPRSGRFEKFESYRARYWKADYFDALGKYARVCEQHSISPTDASLRWLLHHSLLSADKGDGIILGASRLSQLEENLSACRGGRLPNRIIELLDRGWDLTRPDVMKYFRP